MEEALICIPARIGSSRLKAKPLRIINGKPLIWWVVSSIVKFADNILVATDNSKIADALKDLNAKCSLTPENLPSGTDRVAYVVRNLNVKYVINVQGDELFVRKDHVEPVLKALKRGERFATVAVNFKDENDVKDPNNVKIVKDFSGHALYFSRSLIPYPRDGKIEPKQYLRHIGIYGYTKASLLDFVSWGKGKLEDIEKLEQLRILEKGEKIHLSVVKVPTLGVDTEKDIAKAELILRGEDGKH